MTAATRATLMLASAALAGCAAHWVPLAPKVGTLPIAERLPVHAALFIPAGVPDSYVRMRPANKIGKGAANDFPLGQAVEDACVEALSQVFEGLTLVRDFEAAKSSYAIVVTPTVEDFFYYNTPTRTYSGVWITLHLTSRGERVWRLTVQSPQQYAEPAGWFRRAVWDTGADETKGDAASRAIAVCLQELAVKMAGDGDLRDTLLGLRDVWKARPAPEA